MVNIVAFIGFTESIAPIAPLDPSPAFPEEKTKHAYMIWTMVRFVLL